MKDLLIALLQAGFEPFGEPDKRLNHTVIIWFHRSVLLMTADDQADQPWIEYGRWRNDSKNNPPFLEGRYGAQRYPIRCINDLHLFMRNFGYTYDTHVEPTESMLNLLL